MRIPTANIATQSSKIAAGTALRSTDAKINQRQIQAEDSYRRNQTAQAAYIDAEYIEFYTPSTQTFDQERSSLDNRLAMEAATTANGLPDNTSDKASSSRKYQIKNYDAPPPGTFIDLFA